MRLLLLFGLALTASACSSGPKPRAQVAPPAEISESGRPRFYGSGAGSNPAKAEAKAKEAAIAALFSYVKSWGDPVSSQPAGSLAEFEAQALASGVFSRFAKSHQPTIIDRSEAAGQHFALAEVELQDFDSRWFAELHPSSPRKVEENRQRALHALQNAAKPSKTP